MVVPPSAQKGLAVPLLFNRDAQSSTPAPASTDLPGLSTGQFNRSHKAMVSTRSPKGDASRHTTRVSTSIQQHLQPKRIARRKRWYFWPLPLPIGTFPVLRPLSHFQSCKG